MAAALTVTELDRILQDSGFMGEVMGALAAALRARHGANWLLVYSAPNAMDADDQVALSQTLRERLQGLVDRGTLPSWDLVAEAASRWLLRLIKSREEQWDRLSEVTHRTAAVFSARRAGGDASSLFPDQQQRAAVAAEVARQVQGFLGIERTAASEKEVFALAEGLVKENLGAGILEEFLHDAALSEIMIGRSGHIWLEREGRLEDTGRQLPEKRALWFAQRLASVIGSRIDASEPSMDGFLSDGSRVHVLLPPVALDGVSITVRRHARRPTLEQLLGWGALTEEAAAFLSAAVAGRSNILISGGTSSGKTSLLGVIAGFIPPSERVVTMEDAPELRLPLDHVIRLRTRRANIEGQGEFTMRMLVRESLRMRPDRIIVGEVRGAEALDMVEALNTGHDGGLSTAHANNSLDMLKRLGQMIKRGDPTLTDSGAYELIASALHLIVHAERRLIDGEVIRGISEIMEVVAYRPDRPGTLGFQLNPLWQRGADRTLRQVGEPSDRLATHLQLNGVEPASFHGPRRPDVAEPARGVLR